jgi:hypothetical protein
MQAKHTLGLLTLTGNQGWAPRTGDEREAALEIAGREHLREIALCFTVGNGTRVAYWCRIVRDAWGKRLCIEAFTKPMQGAWNGSIPDPGAARRSRRPARASTAASWITATPRSYRRCRRPQRRRSASREASPLRGRCRPLTRSWTT